MQEQDTNGCREIPKRRWVFVHDNDPVVIDEQEVRGSCFFRDYVMGKLECRRLDPNATATESNADLTTTIDRLRELRDRKSARIAEINQKPGDLALEWVRLRLETEVRFCNDQIVRLSRGLPIDQEPHEIAKQAWSERERVARAGGRAETLRDQLAYACHQLARIAGAIDETGKTAEALMTGWGEEHGRAGENTARHVADEALDVMSRAIKLRSEEMAILDALRTAGEPISRWSTQHAVDRRRLRRNVIAADCGIVILERLGMIVVQRHEHFPSDDLISLAPVSKVNP